MNDAMSAIKHPPANEGKRPVPAVALDLAEAFKAAGWPLYLARFAEQVMASAE